MKYIMAEVRQGSITRKVPLIFPNFLVHSEMARVFKHALFRHEVDEVKFVSAGEYGPLFGAGLATMGKSETLGLASDPDDAKVIEMYEYLHGV